VSPLPAPFPPAGTTCQSDVAPLRRVLLKRPDAAFRGQEQIEREWEALHFLAPPDLDRAREEHDRLVRLLEDHGATVELVPGGTPEHPGDGDAGQEGAPTGLDSLYVRDASILTDRGVILCSMGKDARRGEPDEQERYYRAAGIPLPDTSAMAKPRVPSAR